MRIWILPIVAALSLLCGCGQGTAGQQGGGPGADVQPAPEPGDEAPAVSTLDGKRVVMIVARRNFRDEELFRPRQMLENAGAEVTVASSSLRPARGMLGGTVKPDLLIRDIDPDEYDAVVFVGGTGAKEYWEDTKAHEIARRAAEKGKVVAAICLAPVTLANADLLRDKKATVWKSEAGRIEAKGAVYAGRSLEVDGRIITADGPESAEKFGRALVEALAE